MLWYAWYGYDTQAFYFHGKKGAYSECVLAGMWTEAPVIYISCDAQPWLRPLQQPSVTSPVKHEDFLKIVEPNFGNTIFWSAVPFFLTFPQFFLF